jgi:hypothetical protein
MKGRRGLVTATLAEAQRADRVPRISATLARIQVPFIATGQLARELLQRFVTRAACGQHESMQQMQSDGVEPIGLRPLRILRRAPGAQYLDRGIKLLPGDQHGCREPVCEGQPWIHLQDPVRRVKALASPAHRRQAQVMAPFVRFERDRFPRVRDRLI